MKIEIRLASVAATLSLSLVAFAGVKATSIHSSRPQQAPTATDGQQIPTVALAVDPVMVLDRSTRLGHADPSTNMVVSIGMPFADPEGMQRFADSVSDPDSPNFRQFITPEEVGARFGLSEQRVNAIADHLRAHSLDVTLIAKNRLNITCQGTVAQFEAAFSTTIDRYSIDPLLMQGQPDGGNPEYIAPSTPLRAPTSIAGDISDVFGLETYTRPMPRTALTPTQTRGLYDAAPIYNASPTQRGEGRKIGISNFDGYRLTNVPLYYSYYSLPTPSGGSNSNIHVVTITGGGAGAGTAQGEGDLDIQMVLGMAPLCEFYIYDSANNLIATLTQEVNDNLCDLISESYGWNLASTSATSAHNLHVSMTAQGITYMAASGDSGTTLEPYSYPDYEPEVLQVGGTTATVKTDNTRNTEVGWSGSGGGWSTKAVAFNKLPSWQKGTGVPTTVNYRLVPDLALHASGGTTGAYPFYFNGARSTSSIGTSFSSPVLAGMLGIAEQKLIGLGGLAANGAGKQRFGRLQDVIYAQNGRTDVWYDVVSGSNGNFPSAVNGVTVSSCTAKWDMVTGWGAMDINAFVASQTPVACPSDLDGDHVVGASDISWLLLSFGPCAGTPCPEDRDGDGIVGAGDISVLLLDFGPCP